MKNRKTRTLIVSVFLHTLLLIGVFIFQGAIFPYLRFGGLAPLLLPVTAAGIALYEGRDVGALCGLFAGILCDISFNQPVGTFTVVLTVVGIGVGLLSDMVILSGFVSYYIACTIALVICAFVQMTPIVLSQYDTPSGNVTGTAIMQTVYSLALAFPLWFVVRALGRRAQRITPSGKII